MFFVICITSPQEYSLAIVEILVCPNNVDSICDTEGVDGMLYCCTVMEWSASQRWPCTSYMQIVTRWRRVSSTTSARQHTSSLPTAVTVQAWLVLILVMKISVYSITTFENFVIVLNILKAFFTVLYYCKIFCCNQGCLSMNIWVKLMIFSKIATY